MRIREARRTARRANTVPGPAVVLELLAIARPIPFIAIESLSRAPGDRELRAFTWDVGDVNGF
jgi:hypothetical protein